MRKKLFSIAMGAAIAAFSLVSCQKSELPQAKDSEILFGSKVLQFETKSFTESTKDSLQTNGIKVAAVIDGDNSVMFNKNLSYSNGAYSIPNEHYYWPATGTMSFYGVYPATQAIDIDSGVATLSYTQNADTDLLAAKATAVNKTSKAVDMVFDHILSQVSVKAQGEDPTVDYKVFSVKITDANGGTYSYADGIWTPSSSPADYSVYSDNSGMTVSTSEMTTIGSPMSFVPGDAKLNVVWKCYNKGTSTIVCEKDITVDVTLTKGKNTTFNLKLPFISSEIKYVSYVNNWISQGQTVKLLISFKCEGLNNYEGRCEKGMTFSEFINSDYNNSSRLSIGYNNLVFFDDCEPAVDNTIYGDSVIEEGKTYYFSNVE